MMKCCILVSGVLVLMLFLSVRAVFARGDVVIGGSSYPISTFEENGRVVGLDFDIVELILKEAGIKRVRRILKPWKRVMGGLDAGRVDMVVPMVFTKAREEKYLLAPSIRTRFNMVLVRKSFDGQIRSIRDLSGLTVGKCDGYAYQKDFLDAASAGLFTPGYCLDNEMGLRKLSKGRFDAFMIGEDAALYLVRQMGFQGEFKYTAYRAPKASHVGFRKSDASLYKAYLKGFDAVRKKGLIEAAVLSWKTLYDIGGSGAH